jgi:hypothetical protein
MRGLLWWALGLGACANPPKPAPTDLEESGLIAESGSPEQGDALHVALSGPRLLRRATVDLLGRLPTISELNRIEADPGAFSTEVDRLLADPALEGRLVGHFQDRFQLHADELLILYTEYPSLRAEPANEFAFERDLAEEPVRVLARVAASGRPMGEALTADWTMASPLLAQIWPMEREPGEGWTVAHYSDGRPAAGILATNGLWHRLPTNASNLSRLRAAYLSRVLLCADYLQRPVSLSSAAAASAESALREDPYCQGCHASLDPFAATLFGFYPLNPYSVSDLAIYHPERELLGEAELGVTPALAGTPVSGLAALGAALAADPRFGACTVRSAAELLWGRTATAADTERLFRLTETFEANAQSYPGLLRTILLDEVYQAGGLVSEAAPDLLSREATLRPMGPAVLGSVLANLTGFSWTEGGFDQLANDTYGYRVMLGGVDGVAVTSPPRGPTLTTSLGHRRMAEGAAREAIAAGHLNGSLQLGDPGFAEQLNEWWWRTLATRPTEAEIAALEELFEVVAASEGTEEAWVAVLVALFQDPLFTAI